MALSSLVFSVPPSNVRAGDRIDPSVEVTVVDGVGGPNRNFSGTVTVILEHPGGATLSGETTRDVRDGVAVFADLSIDQPGTSSRLRASAQGASDVLSAPFDVVAPDGGEDDEPASLEAVGGGNQRDTVGATLSQPYVVRVTDVDGGALAGVRVSWSVTDGGGAVSPTTSLTGNDGRTSARHTLGVAVGEHAVAAVVAGLPGSPAVFKASATHGAPTTLAFAVQPSDVDAGERITPAVAAAARDQFGNTATAWSGSATVTLEAKTGTGTLSGTLTQGAEDGVVTFADLSIDVPGEGYRLGIRADDLTGATSTAFDVREDDSGGHGDPTTLTRISGDQQTGTVGEPLDADYVVRVTDANDDPVAGVTVTWSVGDGGASVSPVSSSTDSDGSASTRHTLGTEAGTYTVRASTSGVPQVTFSSTGTHATAASLYFSVHPSDAEVGEPIMPAIEVAAHDRYGNAATDFTGVVTLTISENPGGGSLAGTVSRSAAGGVATFPGISIDEPGDGYRLSAAATGLTGVTSATFDITGGGGREPATLVRESGDGQTGPVGQALADAYVVRVTDENGDPVPGVPVTWTVTEGAGSVSSASSTTNDNGLASTRHTLGTGVGTHSVQAAVSGVSPVTFSATATAGAPHELVFTTQPSNTGIGQAISPPVRVSVHDRYGNRITGFEGSLTVSIAPGTGTPGATLSGTPTRTVSNGVATFADLSIDLVGVGYRLRVVGAGLTKASAAFRILL